MTRSFRKGNPFYIYLLFSSAIPRVPFYVGKGCGDREKHHVSKRRSKPSEKSSYIEETLVRGHSVYAVKIFVDLDEAAAFRIERHMIALYRRRPDGPLFNLSKGGQGPSGYVPSKETREKIAAKLRGILWSAEKKAAHSATQKITTNRPEYKEKLRIVMTGRNLSQQHCDAIRAGLTGKLKSEADKAKNGATYAANGRSEKCRMAGRLANTGKTMSKEHRAIMSATHKGKPKPPEQRRKISESNKRTKALRRAEKEKNK